MVPILYDSNETTFKSNGLGRLTDCTRCLVTEERNGVYECEFVYPISGEMFSELTEGRYIYTTHDESKIPQAFRIYFKSAPLEGVCTFRAWHISYALNGIVVKPFTATSAADAIAKITPNSINTNPFTFWTDKDVPSAYKLSVPTAARAILGGGENSLLDVYGKGDYEFDMYTVKLHVNRGSNRGVSLRYGKNLTSLEQERDASSLYSGVVPFWSDSDGENVVSLDHVVYKTGETDGNVVTRDFSDDFEDAPTTTQLEAAAQSWIDGTDAVEIKENITVDFVALWQTEEYKDFANLQRIYLCDTVNIFYEKLGINATAKCIKVVYDSLSERYTSMELGTPKTTLAQQILETTSDTLLKNVPSKSAMQSAIDKATEMIAGGFGGYIKFKYLSDGTPSEMLIMNTDSEATATNIIRLNQNGIGFSTDGGTTYRNAWTIDGNLNADFINTGTINADLIKAGTLADANGKYSLDMSTGTVNMANANITGGSINIETASRTTDKIVLNSASGELYWQTKIRPDGMYFDTTNFSSELRSSSLYIFDRAGTRQVTLYAVNDRGGGFGLVDSAGFARITESCGANDTAYILIKGPDGKDRIFATSGTSGGYIILRDDNETLRAWLQHDKLVFYDANGDTIGQATVEKSVSVSNDRGYIVYANGLAICWARYVGRFDATVAWGSLFETPEAVSFGAMPYTFAATPTVSATVNSGNALWMENIYDTTASNWGQAYFCRATSMTNITATVNLFAIGKAAT